MVCGWWLGLWLVASGLWPMVLERKLKGPGSSTIRNVAHLRLAIAHYLRRNTGTGPFCGPLYISESTKDNRNREEVLDELPIEEGRRAPARCTERVDQFRNRPACCGDHCEASVLQLSLTHPSQSCRLLVWRHGLETSLTILRPDQAQEPIGCLVCKRDKCPWVKTVVALVCLSIEIGRDGIDELGNKLVLERLELIGQTVDGQALRIPYVRGTGACERDNLRLWRLCWGSSRRGWC